MAGKKITNKEKNKIFFYCNKFNISTYDLSDAYNINLISIKKINSKKFKNISKTFKRIIKTLILKNFKTKKSL